jgi:hypothetical protein
VTRGERGLPLAGTDTDRRGPRLHAGGGRSPPAAPDPRAARGSGRRHPAPPRPPRIEERLRALVSHIEEGRERLSLPSSTSFQGAIDGVEADLAADRTPTLEALRRLLDMAEKRSARMTEATGYAVPCLLAGAARRGPPLADAVERWAAALWTALTDTPRARDGLHRAIRTRLRPVGSVGGPRRSSCNRRRGATARRPPRLDPAGGPGLRLAVVRCGAVGVGLAEVGASANPPRVRARIGPRARRGRLEDHRRDAVRRSRPPARLQLAVTGVTEASRARSTPASSAHRAAAQRSTSAASSG